MTTEYHPRLTPWHIDESEFYEIEDPRAQKEFLLRYAVLAPSGHNTQPWTFRLTEYGVEVFADYSRRLPVADPENRELLLSLGASITNLRVAAAHFGFESVVLYQDKPDETLPLALVTLRETCSTDEKLRVLFPAITRRRTHRAEFDSRDIEPGALTAVCDFVEEHAAHARFVLPHDRAHAADLVEQADAIQMSDEKWRRELAEWVRPNETDEGDGLSADAFGIHGPLSNLGQWLVRSFDFGAVKAKRDRAAVESAAGLIVLTGDDDRSSLIQTGEVLERLLLCLTQQGVQYAFLNQPVEVPPLRRELWSLIRSPRPPQLMLRIGYAHPVGKPMPRRPVEAVTV